jgi:hypothetical protein
LDGDHTLSKNAIARAVAAREAALGRKLTPDEMAKIEAIQASARNLKPMPSDFNRSKGSRDADGFSKTPIGSTADPEYIKEIARVQEAIRREIAIVLNGFK